MTAEEYMQGQVTSCNCNDLKRGTDIVEETIALKAIKMARKEERAKACKAYCLVSGCDDAYECHRYFCLEMEVFEKLLNK